MRGIVGSDYSESRWRLVLDLLSTRALLWLAMYGRDGEPLPDVHLYLADRYWRLAACHDRRGALTRADQARAKARAHEEASGFDDPPFAAAMSMPRPEPPVITNAISERRITRRVK
jgi:hypothetical protein